MIKPSGFLENNQLYPGQNKKTDVTSIVKRSELSDDFILIVSYTEWKHFFIEKVKMSIKMPVKMSMIYQVKLEKENSINFFFNQCWVLPKGTLIYVKIKLTF